MQSDFDLDLMVREKAEMFQSRLASTVSSRTNALNLASSDAAKS
jgi:hypothetical protein